MPRIQAVGTVGTNNKNNEKRASIMLRALFASFCLSLTLLLAACGSSSDSSPAASGGSQPSSAVSSNVVKGLIRNGVVRLSRWQAGAYVTVATARTDDAGAYTLSVPSPVVGEVLRLDLDLSTDLSHPTEMLCDAVACGTASFGQWATLTSAPGLSSWVSIDADKNAVVMPMTPVSTLLVHYAERVGGGHMDAGSLGLARQRVASLFNLSTDDLLVRPGNVANGVFLSSASPAAVKLSLLAAAFAQLADNSHALENIIGGYADAFVDNNGHLLQAGNDKSLANLYQALQGVLGAAGNPELQSAVTTWLNNAVAALENGKLNTVCNEGHPCAEFSSDRFLTALGTGPDTLGGDLRRVMLEQNAASLEQLVAQQLSQFGWLASGDTVAVAGVALQSLGYFLNNLKGEPMTAAYGLTPSLNNSNPLQPLLHIEGNQNGMDVNLDIGMPTLVSLVGNTPIFSLSLNGGLENSRVVAAIHGTLIIDPTGTDLTELFTASTDSAKKTAVANLLRTAKLKFSLEGSASLTKKSNDSQLGITGKGDLTINMSGTESGAIVAAGKADYGTLTLPNGMSFSVDPLKHEKLEFSLGADGQLDTQFSANDVLGYDASVSGGGKIKNLGVLLTNLRNAAATQVQAGTFTLATLVSQLLTDASSLSMTVDGSANIPALAHTYTLSYAAGHLVITQPNSTAKALELTFSLSGILAQAGGSWWLIGLDVATINHPAITLSDDTGGEWRWEFDISGLLMAAS